MAIFYVSESGLGDQSGSSIENAKPMSWLNSTNAWNGDTAGIRICSNPTQATIKDEVHFVGTISTPFDWPYASGVGAAGLKFYFEPGAKFSRPHWGAARGSAIFWESAAYAKNNVEIDFGLDGRIEATANGTNLTFQQASTGIIALSAIGLTITNPRIYNMYVRTFGEEQVDNSNGIFVSSYGAAVRDLTITGGTIHDVNIAVNTTGGVGSQNFLLQGIHIYNINWGISCTISSSGASMTNCVIRGNWIHDFANWDVPIETTGLEAFHHNAVFLFAESAAENFYDAVIEGNLFGPNFGTEATSALYLSHWSMKGVYTVRNNVFRGATTNGLLTAGCGAGATVNLHNNTFIVSSPGNSAVKMGGDYAGAGVVTLNSRNNIFSNGVAYNFGYAAKLAFNSDYNLIHGYATPFPGPVVYSLGNTGSALPWSSWQGVFGQDAHSILDQDPLLDVAGKPQGGSPAIGAGADLSGLFVTDYDGAVRVVPWDMGAFKSPGGSTFPPAPRALHNLGTRAFSLGLF